MPTSTSPPPTPPSLSVPAHALADSKSTKHTKLTASLAMAEIRLVLATFIRQFHFQLLTPHQELTPFAIAFTKPTQGEFLLRATERSQ
ncbi:hypothetical protein DSO57_1007812 [Entomophthora muscae]|uniref:Uncharacterized protein n=1 Tax=Entomophthora muscae TaxID=34485 RepID=A0ACC2S994_9FUNG|nr:hypothetical protein DSO57_1007812 [Entomophthora muscae]